MIKTLLKNNLRAIGFITLLEAVVVGLLYLLNQTYGELYAAIQVIDKIKIYQSIGIFSGIAFVLVGINGWLVALTNRLAFSMRTNLTLQYLRTPQSCILVGQRIQEDTRKYTENLVELSVAVFKAGLKLPLFLMVIVQLTSGIVGGTVLVLVLVGTWLTKYMSSKLVVLQSAQETREAVFRSNVDSKADSLVTLASFADIKFNFTDVNQRLKILAFTQQGLGQAFVLVPFIVLMPLYIAKTINMGQFFQAVNALGKVIDSLTVLIDSRQVIVNVQTSRLRLKDLNLCSG